MSRILVFGAAGYTGDLTARRLVADGERPTLVARRAEPLRALAADLGGLEVAVADASDPAALAAVVEPGDVLVATVGPFRHGRTAARGSRCTGPGQRLRSGGPARGLRRGRPGRRLTTELPG